MTGMLAGLADCGNDLSTVSRIIGTSAGSTVGTQIWSGLPFEQLFARQVNPEQQAREISPPLQQLMALLEAFRSCAGITDPIEKRQRLGRIAIDSATVSEGERLAVIAGRLPSPLADPKT